MPSFTFTAATNDILTTSADHGLVTGSGPLVLRNIGGALPAATPSLAPLTEYWAILVDPNELKIATSQANALLGTAIDITGTGTGTHFLEYGIPYRRARTYAPLSQVFSTDLNALQDALVALHGFLTSQTQSVFVDRSPRHISALSGRQVDTGTAMSHNVTTGYPTTTAATNVFRVPVVVNDGEKITQVDFRIADAGTDVLTMKVWRHDMSGGSPSRTQLGSTATSTGSTGVTETLTSGAFVEDVGSQHYDYYVEFTCTFSSGCTLNSGLVTML